MMVRDRRVGRAKTAARAVAGVGLLLLGLTAVPAQAGSAPTVSVADAQVVEGDQGAGTLDFQVTITGNTTGQPVYVEYRTYDGTALGEFDYEPASGLLTFQGVQQTQEVNVFVYGDREDEPDETVFLELTSVRGPAGGDPAVIGDGTGIGTIIDDDESPPPPVTLTIAPGPRFFGLITGPGISCGDIYVSWDCSQTYPAGTTVTLTATGIAPAGTSFLSWGKACFGQSTNVCTLTMDSSQAACAVFRIDYTPHEEPTEGCDRYRLEIDPVPTAGRIVGPDIDCGAGGYRCVTSYLRDSNVELTALPPSTETVLFRSDLDHWGKGCAGARGSRCHLTMTANRQACVAFRLFLIKQVSVAEPGVACPAGG